MSSQQSHQKTNKINRIDRISRYFGIGATSGLMGCTIAALVFAGTPEEKKVSAYAPSQVRIVMKAPAPEVSAQPRITSQKPLKNIPEIKEPPPQPTAVQKRPTLKQPKRQKPETKKAISPVSSPPIQTRSDSPKPIKQDPPPLASPLPAIPKQPSLPAMAASPAVPQKPGPDQNVEPDQPDPVIAALISLIEKYKSYPRVARRLKLHGVTRVVVAINKSGKISGYHLKKSSGHRALDKATLKTLRRIKGETVSSIGLGQTMNITVPVRYEKL